MRRYSLTCCAETPWYTAVLTARTTTRLARKRRATRLLLLYADATDGAADGWFGSWLGVRQGEWLSPQYKMGPEDGLEESFELYCLATKK
ncbi:MAG: hypothetical protein CM15mV74_280 [uncultured marine virus]|nr:MAG: hypothetical protein CM15mV74_280 [uncultured marine virus]